MDLALHITKFTWTGGAPVLRETLARHAGESADDLVRKAEEWIPLGFTTAYVNAVAIPEPDSIIDAFAHAIPRLRP